MHGEGGKRGNGEIGVKGENRENGENRVKGENSVRRGDQEGHSP